MKSNIIPLKRKSKGLEYKIGWQILEDGSIWYRLTDIKTGDWAEWVKYEDD